MKTATLNQSRPLDDVQNHSKLVKTIKLPSIGSEKQYRFVLANLENPKSTKYLLEVCAVTNVADVAARLRKRGWDIEPIKAVSRNRYGESCDAYYWNILTHYELAKEALRAWRLKHPLKQA